MLHMFNYIYAARCIKMIAKEETMHRTYNFKVTSLGVLYTVMKIDKEVPAAKVHMVFDNRLAALNDAIIGMNLDGIINNRLIKIKDVDDEIYDWYKFELYPIKYKQALFMWLVTICLAIKLIIYSLAHYSSIVAWVGSFINKIQHIISHFSI